MPLSDRHDDGGQGPHEDFEDLFENAPCGYVSLLPDGRIAMVNRILSAWTGYPREDLIGRRIHDILQFSARIFLETHILPLLRMQGAVEEVALDFTTANGTVLSILANAAERRDDAGRHVSTRLILLKATDRRKYERDLVTARDRAEGTVALEREASELREQFIAVLGHDLRNPLAAISGGVRLLGREALSGRGKRILGLMEGSVVRAAGLIDNVLDFARGRLGGGLTLSRERNAPLRAVLIQVVAELRSIAPDRTVEAYFAINRAVNCDPTRIGQLASNLLGNALTHGDPGQPVKVDCITTDEGLELSIANGGKPIPPDALARLFHPFVRGEAGRVNKGLGLGLYIASQIARAHGGELTATSSDEETRFTFAMPLDPVAHQAANP